MSNFPPHDKELASILQRLGDQALWRPLDMVRELLQHRDPKRLQEPLAQSLLQVDFQGKSVVELGSNIGLYSFLAALLGAREVHALDFGPDIVRLGNLLALEHGMQQVAFRLEDFSNCAPEHTWDLALLLDIIGHNKVRKGRVDAVMDTLLRYSEKEMVFNVRPVYRIEEELGVSPQALAAFYPAEHLREGRLHLLEYLIARHDQEWTMRLLELPVGAEQFDKPAVHCQRKAS